MALWILNRPADLSDLTELRVAELLATLSDEWVIRWGFHYQDNAGTTREGDFLVLGPHGGLMVIEVKAGSLDVFPRSGRWATDGHDHPLFQLDQEWKAVVNEVNVAQAGRPPLFVTKALALPQLDLAPNLDRYHDIPRQFILTSRDLREFPNAWAARFKDPRIYMDGRSREIFFDTFGKSATPKAIRHFVDEADRALLRQTECNYEFLDLLAGNQQFMVSGGTGSGKTWLAFELAFRWAEQGVAGSRVLFLCYNLALTDFLRELARKAQAHGKSRCGSVDVMSWEELAKSLLTKAGLPFDVPSEQAKKADFFVRIVPELMAQVVEEKLCTPEYDALIVDEAQDHDTSMAAFPPGWVGPGWWGVYWNLLKDGASSRIGLFYDPAQRPAFRSPDGFDAEAIHGSLRANPVRVRLQKSVRYSRPILGFLKSLHAPAVAELVDGLQQRGSLPEGPDVEVHTSPREDTAKTVATIVRRWTEGGFCRPDEILILSLHGRFEKSALSGSAELNGIPIVDFLKRQRGCISMSSVNKAKGLDALGVILVDFKALSEHSQASDRVSYFMGASRARQLLAIVHQSDDVPLSGE